MVAEQDFRTRIRGLMREAQAAGASFVDINSGQVHRAIGGYPGPDHRMPVCCQVMKTDMRAGDRILASPPKGQGASLTIRYQLPRR
jgi:5-methylcytosine-specific restriction protein A